MSLRYRAVVVVGYAVDRFLDNPGFVIGHERIARERRQVFRVPAEPDPRHEDEHQREHEYEQAQLAAIGHA